jgi:hydroxymethylpyrimidine pyrophosphatase-like HAD family hydrolase
MAVGDNMNDLEMLEYAGCPVVMGNGLEVLKRRGWPVTASNDEAGVARAIETFVFGTAS